MVGKISRLQHFSIGDGPGIRSTLFFQGCNLHCVWCHNPETISREPVVLFYEEKCKECGRCVQVCAKGCHSFDSGVHLIQREICRHCGACVQTCTQKALELSGKEVTPEEVYQFFKEDQDFYEASGGGVTLSGGEPLLQADFCREILQKCCEDGIHTIVDTAGNVEYHAFEKVMPVTSLFYYDIKATNEQDYRRWTGGNAELIYTNLKRLIADGASVEVRIPLIPQYNLSQEYGRALISVLCSCGVKKVHLLPFHRLGSGKYRALSQAYACEKIVPPKNEEIRQLKELFSSEFETAVAG